MIRNIILDLGNVLLNFKPEKFLLRYTKDENIVDKVVQDDDRLSYLQRYFEAASRAINEGVNLKDYFVWSLMDNFEWLWGYSKRFGIIRVDYETQERMWKKSALWYRDVIENNGFGFK